MNKIQELVRQVQLDCLEEQVLQDHKVIRGKQDLLGLVVLLAHLGSMVHLALKALVDPQDRLGQMAILAPMVLWVQVVLQDR